MLSMVLINIRLYIYCNTMADPSQKFGIKPILQINDESCRKFKINDYLGRGRGGGLFNVPGSSFTARGVTNSTNLQINTNVHRES
jgi:hypothetical protein